MTSMSGTNSSSKAVGGLPQFKTTSVFGGIKIRVGVVECGGKRSAMPLSSPMG